MSTSATIDRTACEQNAQCLSQILADTYVLYLKTQFCHWNVTDARFHSMHEMFEEQYKELAEAVDELAERIRMLKLKAPGSMRQFLKMTTLEEAGEEMSGNDMLRALCHDREAIAKHIRPKIEDTINTGDQGTGDLLIQHLRMHEKAAWMLRSHFVDEDES
jgi:starvation-inducible DNA-binding protein